MSEISSIVYYQSKRPLASLNKATRGMVRLLSRYKQHKPLIFGLGLALVLALGYLLLRGDSIAQLIGFFTYMSVACTLIPLPTPPVVMGMGEIFHPGVVAMVGAIGNCIAALLEYRVTLWICSKTELEQKLERVYLFRKFAHYYAKAAFACLVFSGFTPVPFEPFRYAAILTRYPLRRYLLAVFVGRFPRYYLVALLGNRLALPAEWMALMLVVLFVIPVSAAMTKAWRR